MPSSFNAGSVINDRYVVKKGLKVNEIEYSYIVEDRRAIDSEYSLCQLLYNQNGSLTDIKESASQTLTSLLSINHPNIQKIKDFFWIDNQLFLVLENIDGKSCHELFKNGVRLTESEAISLLTKMLHAISCLHDRGIAHQNVSPSSIIIRKDDKTPILIDLGEIREVKKIMGCSSSKMIDLETIGLSHEQTSSKFIQDLHDLALTILMLVTGQEYRNLYNYSSQRWDWEQWILLNDQLTNSLQKMLYLKSSLNHAVAESSTYSAQQLLDNLTITLPTTQTLSSLEQKESIYLRDSLKSEKRESTRSEPIGLRGWHIAVVSGAVIGIFVIASLIIYRQFGRQIFHGEKPDSPLQDAQFDPTPAPIPAPIPAPAPAPIPIPTPDPIPTPAISDTNATIAGQPGMKNIRSGPGTNYNVVGEVGTGERVKILSQNTDVGGYIWFEIYYPSSQTQGWIAAQLLRAD